MPLFQCKKCGQYVHIQSNKDQFQHEKACKPNKQLMQQNGYAKELEREQYRKRFLSYWGI